MLTYDRDEYPAERVPLRDDEDEYAVRRKRAARARLHRIREREQIRDEKEIGALWTA